MNITEVTEKLNINPDTLRKWEKYLNLSIQRTGKNKREYSEEDFKLIEKIKEMRDLDHGFNTITRELKLDNNELKQSLDPVGSSLESNNTSTTLSNHINTKLEILQNTLDNKLNSILELSEKYSRACFEIGSLQSKLEAKEESLKEAQVKIKLISDSSGKDVSNLNKEIERIKLDNEYQQKKHRMENEQLKTELDREKKKPWYKKLFNK